MANDTRLFAIIAILFITGFGLRSLYTNHSNDSTSTAPNTTNGAPHTLQPLETPQHSRVAAIIENRPLANLIPLILHFSSVLGPSWPIHVFHTAANEHLFLRSHAFGRSVARGAINLTKLPADTTFASHADVSRFLAADTHFWDLLAPAQHVLLFQADSILCANSPQRVEDYLQWDLVGAPIDPQYGVGYNGGLSLRNRTAMIEAVKNNVWAGDFEDQWFFARLGEMGAKLPSREEAKTFSVETIWAEEPMGLHQVRRWQSGKLAELDAWCPEYKLADDGSLYKPH